MTVKTQTLVDGIKHQGVHSIMQSLLDGGWLCKSSCTCADHAAMWRLATISNDSYNQGFRDGLEAERTAP